MILVVGAGLSGATVARVLAEDFSKKVLVIDSRDHIGGNCYDHIDEITNIRVSKYGAHLFHTNNKRVWDFVQRFSEWVRWEHTVVAKVDNSLVPIPVNGTTINVLCNETLQTEEDIQQWLDNQTFNGKITNSEEMAKSRIGNVLYEKLVKTYTYKQWNKYPEQLKPEVLARIPARSNFDTRYFTDKYQALPKNGYTSFIENMLNHPLITVKLETDFFNFTPPENTEATFFTGQIDQYFSHVIDEKLEYRSIEFHTERIMNHPGFFLPNSVVNYPSDEVPYTRIVEYKHLLNQKSDHTIIVKETTNDHGPAYYPVPDERNSELYKKFQKLAEEEERSKKVFFIGRLASYKYFNMDQAIFHALELMDRIKGEQKLM